MFVLREPAGSRLGIVASNRLPQVEGKWGMSRAPLTASAFALTSGHPADARAFVAVETPGPDRSFGVAVEPLEFTPRGVERAMLARAAIEDALRRMATLEPSLALARAFAAADAAVAADNRPPDDVPWERRSLVGATAFVVDARGMTLAQTPPAQAIVVQDGQAYAFPDLRSWRADYDPGQPVFEPAPLGAGQGARPLLYRSVAAPGDVILLCSSTVARLLAHQGKPGRTRRDEALRSGEADRILDLLENTVAASDLDDAFALAIALGTPVTRRFSAPGLSLGQLTQRFRLPNLASSGHGAGRDLAERPAARAGRRTTEPAARRDEPISARRASAAGPPARRISARIVLPDRLRDGIVAAVEATMPRRRALEPAFSSRQRTLAAPGVTSIQRHRESGGLPPEWHANLPRGFDVHVPGRALAAGLAVMVALGGTRFYVQQQQARQERIDAAIVQLDDALRSVRDDPAHQAAAVATAQSAWDAAMRVGADATALGDRGQMLAAARANAWHVESLTNLTLLGAIPAAMAGQPVHLTLWGDHAYLVVGGVYQIDAEHRQLIRMLAPGDAIDGRRVDPIATGAADADGLVVADDASTFLWTPDGKWRAIPLTNQPNLALARAPVAAYGDVLYALDAGGQIIKLGDGQGDASVWAGTDAFPDLAQARDLTVDGSVHVLLADGRVLTFYQHALKGSTLPALTPALEQPAYLAQAAHSEAFYIVDPTARLGDSVGRLVRATADGAARQFVAPGVGADLFAHAQDVAVDERAGTVYLVVDGQLWQAALPPVPGSAPPSESAAV